MQDIDLKKRSGGLNKPSARIPSVIRAPRLRYLMLDGTGDIESPEFTESVRTLYGLAFPVKFAAGKRLSLRYPMMPLEAVYRDKTGAGFTPESRATCQWQLMLMLPDEVSGEFVDEVRVKVSEKKDLVRLDDVRVQTFSGGLSVQVMHVGPYSDEMPTIRGLRAFAAEQRLEITGDHHEIYLGKIARSDPSKLKTVLRYAVSKPRA